MATLSIRPMARFMVPSPHRALFCDDILEEIFLRLQECDEQGARPLGSLARSAVVCRTFSPHALDALWADVDSLVPILQLFPARRLKVECQCNDMTNPESTVCMERIVNARSMRRFQGYARRIRALHVHAEFNQSARTAFLLSLSKRQKHSQKHSIPLFPNLQRLRWGARFFPDPCFTLVLTPSVRHVELNWDSRRDPNHYKDVDELAVLASILPPLLRILPVLEGLYVDGVSPWDALSFPELSHWTHLRAFGSRDLTVDVQTFHVLSRMEKLQELRLFTTKELAFHDRLVQDGFLGLRSLSIVGWSFFVPPVLASFCHANHLRTLRLYAGWHSDIMTPQLIQALSDLRHVEHVFLDTPYIDLLNLIKIPRLWQGLKTCELSDQWPPNWRNPNVQQTLDLLLAFAQRFPCLETLSLPPIDFQPILPPNAPTETGGVLSMSLRELNIKNMYISALCEEALPAFIDRSFPALDLRRMAQTADKRTHTPWEPYDDKWLRWADVVERVKTLRDAAVRDEGEIPPSEDTRYLRCGNDRGYNPRSGTMTCTAAPRYPDPVTWPHPLWTGFVIFLLLEIVGRYFDLQ
ncbi:uncharacterized protein B0H18DRAFT_1210571 [Fomitopsis serialis]|uniref:uncharacterized protein n=1 Tax=Fomitopsis serialis TaxID=139415 RepID=UPI00200831DA|nr:uncharacterized protein B0H18DRAFT_1210571 [Neoantrodia serialis]KAH9927577.1 hypothetical protein B0H18DRAFT_1210571 [Neoantrodia serialis]